MNSMTWAIESEWGRAGMGTGGAPVLER